MRKIMFVLLALVFVCAAVNVASAASADQVKKVIDLARQAKVGDKLISRTNVDDNGSFFVAYMTGGKHYYMFYAAFKDVGGIYVSFSVRPAEMSESLSDLEVGLEDVRLDGKVDSVSQGRKHEPIFNLARGEGLDNQDRWQEFYDKIIADALKHFAP